MALIGEVAARSGVSVQAVRYYERLGLLSRPRRRASGYREYEPDAVRLVRFIKRAQGLGFSLREIADLVRLREGSRLSCAQMERIGCAKVESVERKIRDLRAIQRALRTLLHTCQGGLPRRCPILDAFDGSRPVTVSTRPRPSSTCSRSTRRPELDSARD